MFLFLFLSSRVYKNTKNLCLFDSYAKFAIVHHKALPLLGVSSGISMILSFASLLLLSPVFQACSNALCAGAKKERSCKYVLCCFDTVLHLFFNF